MSARPTPARLAASEIEQDAVFQRHAFVVVGVEEKMGGVLALT